jgi:hypothetical protein
VSVDYRLLHHFRVSQRREMASRGELTVLRTDEQSDGEPAVERRAKDDSSVVPAPLTPALPATAPALPPKPQRGQVLTHLLNEDR